MAYSELIKNFDRVRDYMRRFYVYGFQSRNEFTRKSARSYDDERRRIESWLGDYMGFRQTAEGKNVFLSIDSRAARHNPLYRAWKAKSFTAGDITLHFLLMDLLWEPSVRLTLTQIMEQLDAALSGFQAPRLFDVSTVRKKLKEYVDEGLVVAEKRGKTVLYRRADDAGAVDSDLLDLASEIMPCGVIGSFLLDRCGAGGDHFAFKHHYITATMDSDILCSVFDALRERRCLTLTCVRRNGSNVTEAGVVPLRIMVSVQNGRQYLMAFSPAANRIRAYRLDYILSVVDGDVCGRFDALQQAFERMRPHLWGVSTRNHSSRQLEWVSFTVQFAADEDHIPRRLEREKRCGTVERLDENHCRFSAQVYDASELVPWMRTYLCRITEVCFSNKRLERQFKNDIREMYALYGLEGGDGDDLQ